MTTIPTVLIIDDDPISNFLLEKLLISLGITNRVFVAKNGEDGIAFLKNKFIPSIIFLDWNMPVLSGEEFLTELSHDLQNRIGDTQIIAISNLFLPEHISKLESLKISHLLKPFNKDRISLALDHVHLPS